MESLLVSLFHLLGGHPYRAASIIFLAAFLESVAFVGTFVPGSTVMFLAGALIGAGSLNTGVTFACAVAGAIIGDGMSYWIGHRYDRQIEAAWPFRQHPDLMDKGREFFARHGGKSIFLARFVGPVRAVVPVVAGMMKMGPTRFYAINVLSALAWAPAHILPGILFGASLKLAGAVTLRLTIILALLTASIWILIRLVRLLLPDDPRWLQRREAALTRWAGDKRNPLSWLVLRVFDPRRHAAGAVIAMAGLLLIGAWIFFGVIQDLFTRDPLVRVDSALFHFLHGLRSPWTDDVMAIIAGMGGPSTIVPVVLAVAFVLVVQRHWRTLVYWAASLGLSQLLIAIIRVVVGGHRPPPATSVADLYSFPSGHAATSTVVYGFLAFLLSRQCVPRKRLVIACVAAVIIFLIAFSGLYLGAFRLSDALGGVAFGIVWVGALSVAYVYHRPASLRVNPTLALVAAVAAGSVGIGAWQGQFSDVAEHSPAPPAKVITEARWKTGDWRTLPVYRVDLEGEREEAFSIQWAASAYEMTRQLNDSGWQAPPEFSIKSLLLWISPETSVMQLPVLPRLNDGQPDELEFIRRTQTPNRRLVLRLWRTPYLVRTAQNVTPVPLWLGSATSETTTRLLKLLTLVHTDSAGTAIEGVLKQSIFRPGSKSVDAIVLAPPS